MSYQDDYRIQIRDLYKGYNEIAHLPYWRIKKGKKYVLENINFGVKEKEFVSILGKSGSGKTTMLHLIAGFLKPDKGEIVVSGKIKRGPNKEIGVIFQDYVLFPWYTVYQNVSFGLKVSGMSKQDIYEATMECLKLVELEEYKDYYPCQLSGGMKQRVGIARTLVNSPSTIIMDEPLSAQDKNTKERLYQILKQYGKAQGTTFLLVTHSIEEAVSLADRAIVLNDKRIALDIEINLGNVRDKESPEFSKYMEVLGSVI